MLADGLKEIYTDFLGKDGRGLDLIIGYRLKRILTYCCLAFVCLLTIVGTTWAWFSDSRQLAVDGIQAARFEADIYMYEGSLDVGLPMTMVDGSIWVEADQLYTITVRSSGTAQSAYLWVQDADGAEYYSAAFALGPERIFRFEAELTGAINVEARWGRHKEAISTAFDLVIDARGGDGDEG